MWFKKTERDLYLEELENKYMNEPFEIDKNLKAKYWAYGYDYIEFSLGDISGCFRNVSDFLCVDTFSDTEEEEKIIIKIIKKKWYYKELKNTLNSLLLEKEEREKQEEEEYYRKKREQLK